jgi:hypothetical protein
MGFVGKEGLQTSGTTYKVALPHMSPTRSVMSRFSFQARTYLISGSRSKPLENRIRAEKAAIEICPYVRVGTYLEKLGRRMRQIMLGDIIPCRRIRIRRELHVVF